MFMTSKDEQRKLMVTYKKFSGITSLFNEEGSCDNLEFCDIYKNAQPISKPTTATKDYTSYSDKFRRYAFKYIFGDDTVSAEDVLGEIDDITRIYYVTLNFKESPNGMIAIMIYLVFSIIIIISSAFLFIKKYEADFAFLPRDFWILSLFGYILILCISILDLGKLEVYTCHLKQLFQLISSSLIFGTVFYKLIINFPEENKISKWFSQHRYVLIGIFMAIDIILFLLFFISPYIIEDVIVNEGKNFQKCQKGGIFSKILLGVASVYIFSMVAGSLFLIFLEWFLKETYRDVRY
eukprot:jgi/Orpsp1_1/1178144/evm.model.c7180000064204.2